MIKIRNVKINIEKDDIDNVLKKVIHILKININDILDYEIVKKSIDAREKPIIYYVYEINLSLKNENKVLKNKNVEKVYNENYEYKVTGTKKMNNRPIIVGSGPAGLFCAYFLAKENYKPIIIEQGKKIEDRVKDVEKFWNNEILLEDSNVVFGEGGAGTFSDGKLNTSIKDKKYRIKEILKIFVECGADSEILYINKPHIGTDMLRKVIINMRNKIITYGGEFRYSTKLTNIVINDNKLQAIEVNNSEVINCDLLVLAIGHSARDTFKMLYKNHINMESKNFAVGVRIQHPQEIININQYGKDEKLLPPASYKLTYNNDNRGIYSFCMCPGGFVVNSSSLKNTICINGMSNHKRDSKNANSAIIVTVNKKDFGEDVFSGMNFQEELEKKAYILGKGKIPVQKYVDYKNNTVSSSFGKVEPIFKGNYTFANINDLFPDYINKSLVDAIEHFSNKIKGFNMDDAIIAAVESRTSSPVRINRNDDLMSNVYGIYPCGEGAGFAGGITSAAVDGIKIFEKIIEIYKKC